MPTGAPIILVSYDPRWPGLFDQEKRRLLTLIQPWAERIEHVGSTSVPGLDSKPIIDIMIGVTRLEDARHCIEPIQSLDYEYVPEYEDVMPERRFFRKGSPDARTHHIHLVETTSDFWERHLIFRDYLRLHPRTAREYLALKLDLAAKHSDVNDYAGAKTPFIQAVTEKARRSL